MSHHRQQSSESPSSEDSDDDEGHVLAKNGDLIEKRYQVLGFLGKGAFGKVLEVEDIEKKEVFALKVVRDVDKYREDAKEEARILRKVHKYNTSPYVISLQDMFSIKHRGRRHMCLMFKPMGKSLYEFMKANKRRGFRLSDVEAIGYQLLKAVNFCHSNRLVHTDLKPENILLKDSAYHFDRRSRSEYRIPDSIDISLIDFGGATFHDQHHASIINTRQYRAPEVILGLPWSYPSDIWSIGCILFELYKGHLLFPTHQDIEHLAMMEKVLHKPISSSFIAAALEPFYESSAYRRLRSSSSSSSSSSRRRSSQGSDDCKSSYRSPDRSSTRKRKASSSRQRSKRRRRSDSRDYSGLDSSTKGVLQLLDWKTRRIRWPDKASDQDSIDRVAGMKRLQRSIHERDFLDLLEELLTVDPQHRISASEALQHRFFRYVKDDYE